MVLSFISKYGKVNVEMSLEIDMNWNEKEKLIA